MEEPIYVTKPFLPPLEEFTEGLKTIWDSHYLTNVGPYHQKLEEQLKEYFDVPYVSLFSNATLALYTSLKVLELENCDIITTPFSFPATAHVIRLVNSTPIFVDIDRTTGCIDATLIEKSITSKTHAILPVHVYGNNCNTALISLLAKKYNLKVIYDAAHSFRYHNAVLNDGDLSVISFHATKIFNTFEGGVIISHDKAIFEKIYRFRQCGYLNEDDNQGIGINAKMTEIQALAGILNLKYVDHIFELRKKVTQYYDDMFIGRIETIPSSNYSYYPVLLNNRDKIYERLIVDNNIYPRKYFYPLISNLNEYKYLKTSSIDNLIVANTVAEQILCLPIYPDLSKDDQDKIINIVLS
jgi:dTDP-4-amino-4,6-dideoxy-D-glucose transaminase